MKSTGVVVAGGAVVFAFLFHLSAPYLYVALPVVLLSEQH